MSETLAAVLKMTNDVSEFPSMPQGILEAAASGTLVIFVGAGISSMLGCPSWDSFSKSAVEFLFEKGAIIHRDREDLLERVMNPRTRLSLCWPLLQSKDLAGVFLKSVLRIGTESNIHDLLVETGAALVTTNYDINIDCALERLAMSPTNQEDSKESRSSATNLQDYRPIEELTLVTSQRMSSFYENDLTIDRLLAGRVMHLHGRSTHPDSMVVTNGDYVTAYAHHPKRSTPIRRDLLYRMFVQRVVLFLGYGLDELEILEYIKLAAPPHLTRHYLLFPIDPQSFALKQFYADSFEQLGIECVFFDKTVHGPRQIEAVISKWLPKISSVSAPLPTAYQLRIIDESLGLA